ncbi:MAG TPA: hypothetical protein VH500_16410 [Nitrososphaeraceae archaeon]
MSEIILEAVPVKATIYDDTSDIETKYVAEWRISLNSSFTIGPASLCEIILILEWKSLILQENMCDTALISYSRLSFSVRMKLFIKNCLHLLIIKVKPSSIFCSNKTIES